MTKKQLTLIVFIALATSFATYAAKIKVAQRGDYVRIDETRSGQPYVVYLKRSAILSLTMVKIDRGYTVQITSTELVSQGNTQANKTYTYSFFSEAEAIALMDELTLYRTP